ncbi:hypothetical protein [Pseudomonas fluvialis]|uniref:hypothetical protein n=1 Tax=Pseudomonas fluvialis TaxID=1793966 RepID=UPI0035B117EB
MATVSLKSALKRQFGNTPYGNLSVLSFALATLASGAAADSDSTTAIAAGDVIDLGPLPEGMRLDDAQIIVSTGMTATITGSLGFKYEDGTDSTEAPQDAAYFGSGIDLAAAGRKRATGTKLLTLAKPARLILTTAVAANAKASDLKVLVYGEQVGAR